MATLSIDAGTFNYCAIIDSNGKQTLVREEEGNHTIPSVVHYNPQGAVSACGKRAYSHYWKNPNTVRCAKRIIGLQLNSSDLKHYQKDCIAEVISGDDHYPRFRMRCFPDNSLTPTSVTRDLIQYVGELAKRQSELPIETLIVTVPAFFTQHQRLETQRAAKEAHICENVHTVSEPVAAAYKYHLEGSPENANVMVVDFGGGTLDICIMKPKGDSFSVLATGGKRQLGGEDVTKRLVDFVEQAFQERFHRKLIPIPKSSKFYRTKREALQEKVEEAKCQLSISDETEIVFENSDFCMTKLPLPCADTSDVVVEMIDEPQDYTFTIRRSDLEAVTKQLMNDVKEAIRLTLARIHFTPRDIDHVILVGGSSRLVTFQNVVRELFADKVMVIDDPDECVARGASLVLRHSILSDRHALFDALPNAYGTVIFDDFKGRDVFEPIIPRGTPFPNETVFSKTFYLARRTDGSYIDFADIGLYISEEGGPDGATLYKDFGVTGLSTDSRNRVIVSFSIDHNGMISVEVRESVGNHVVFPKQNLCEIGGIGAYSVCFCITRLYHPFHLLRPSSFQFHGLFSTVRRQGKPQVRPDLAVRRVFVDTERQWHRGDLYAVHEGRTVSKDHSVCNWFVISSPATTIAFASGNPLESASYSLQTSPPRSITVLWRFILFTRVLVSITHSVTPATRRETPFVKEGPSSTMELRSPILRATFDSRSKQTHRRIPFSVNLCRSIEVSIFVNAILDALEETSLQLCSLYIIEKRVSPNVRNTPGSGIAPPISASFRSI